MEYMYVDSVHNIVLYPDGDNRGQLQLESFEPPARTLATLNLCAETSSLIDVIDDIDIQNKILQVTYLSRDCRSKKTKRIDLQDL